MAPPARRGRSGARERAQETRELIQALHGRISAHHRRLLKLHLGLIDSLQQALATVDADVGKTLAPIEKCARLLTTMPGVSELTAHVLVAEIGVDMARFPTAGHLLSWARDAASSGMPTGLTRRLPTESAVVAAMVEAGHADYFEQRVPLMDRWADRFAEWLTPRDGQSGRGEYPAALNGPKQAAEGGVNW